MKRWNGIEDIEMPKVDAFIEEVIALGKKHNLSIAHEDEHGGFIICKYSKLYADWFREAQTREL